MLQTHMISEENLNVSFLWISNRFQAQFWGTLKRIPTAEFITHSLFKKTRNIQIKVFFSRYEQWCNQYLQSLQKDDECTIFIWSRRIVWNHRPRVQKLLRNSSAQSLAREFTANRISQISLSISSMNSTMKSTSLCLYIASTWVLVIKKLIS